MVRGQAWWGECVARDMRGREHAWQGVCVAGGMPGMGGMHGGGCVCGRGCAWQRCAWRGGACGRGHVSGCAWWRGMHGGRCPQHVVNVWVVRILLECILVFLAFYESVYVSLRLHVQNAVPAQPCVGKLGISLVLLNFLHCNFRLWFKTT